MKKFNVKVLSIAVAAAVASSAAGAAEQNFAAAVGKDNLGKAAFFTVFGEGTKYDKDTGKLTFKNDSDALLLKTLELEQTINGFAAGKNFVATNEDGSKTVRAATNEDIAADSLKGIGLVGGLTDVNARVDDLVNDTVEALNEQDQTIGELKTAITTVATDVTELDKSVSQMGEDISAKFDEVDGNISRVSGGVADLAEAVKQSALAAAENAQALNGFKEGNEIVVTDDNGIKSVKEATKEDVEQDDFRGLGLKEVVARHDQSLADLTAETERAKKAAEQAAFAAIENAQELNGFKEGDEIVVTDDDGAKSTKTATKADVDADSFGGSGLKEVVADHDKELDGLTETVNKNSKALEDFNTAIDKKADKADIETTKKAASDAEKAASEAKESVKSVQDSVKVAQQSAQTAAEDAKAAKTSADAANNVANAAKTAVDQIQDKVKANTAQVATNKADIAKVQDAVKANTAKVATYDAAITTLQTESKQYAAGIAKNSARIDSLDQNVANLRKETRQGLAAQAALSGLFQPYSVGKFNVTAALGGFKSDTAVAVGAGYRFNENFAAKAGLAVGTSSGGSASYNVGLNYEW